jgi:hypothetical protein
MNFQLDFPIMLGTFGVVFLALWLAALFGVWKKWYWRSQTGMVYGYIGISLASFAAAFQPQFVEATHGAQWLSDGLIIFFLGLAIVLAYFSPKFLKPKWIKQIEREPKYVYKTMVAQIKDGYAWQEKMVDYYTLESWIKEIKKTRRKK